MKARIYVGKHTHDIELQVGGICTGMKGQSLHCYKLDYWCNQDVDQSWFQHQQHRGLQGSKACKFVANVKPYNSCLGQVVSVCRVLVTKPMRIGNRNQSTTTTSNKAAFHTLLPFAYPSSLFVIIWTVNLVGTVYMGYGLNISNTRFIFDCLADI
jgi:hypothetical protein